MSNFQAPLRDIEFVLFELFDYEPHCQSVAGGGDLTKDLTQAILAENARFCQDVLAPLNAIGDSQGCQWHQAQVTTPEGFKDAYQQYCAAGWPSMTRNTQYGGQGLPQSLGVVLNEMVASANAAWAMYPGLSQGAMHTIEVHGTDDQRQAYLPKLISGDWTGTMCLTEAHCGSDLGLLRTRAEPQADGRYLITGTKIFISAGDHDMADNIVHIVLARLPDAPAGTKGISLFIVPKYQVNPDGTPGKHNQVHCGSIEHKMGIHGNATCVLNFDGASATLLGEANKGLNGMFTFMNLARLGTGSQGLALAEAAWQKSLAYARERLQMRALTGPKNPAGIADPIIVHPDVRRMLLTQKALIEGSRMLAYFAAIQVDISQRAESASEREAAEELLGILTPIAKAFMTETGFESANHALQCFGGHGYIREWGLEQIVRDARIASLYEGTTGIQALDLLGRKILLSQGRAMQGFVHLIEEFCQAQVDNEALTQLRKPLVDIKNEWLELTQHIGLRAMNNPEEIGAASVDYIMYSGYVALAYLWARAALCAQDALQNQQDVAFYQAKLHTARFYYERILPRTRALAQTMKSGAANLMELPDSDFAF
jgi:alkylation response protein AidB-like acyl-CoA dehydrogenase